MQYDLHYLLILANSMWHVWSLSKASSISFLHEQGDL